jgi:hypothetical protein
VQPFTSRLEEHAVDIDASAVARMDVVRVGAWSPDRGRGQKGRLGICRPCKHRHEQGHSNQQDDAFHENATSF